MEPSNVVHPWDRHWRLLQTEYTYFYKYTNFLYCLPRNYDNLPFDIYSHSYATIFAE